MLEASGVRGKEPKAAEKRSERSPLQSDRGRTIINDALVISIASEVRQAPSGEPEIGGHSTTPPGDNSPAMGVLFGRVRPMVSPSPKWSRPCASM